MVAFRVLNDLMLKSVNPNVVYDNAMSEDEFVEKINKAMSSVPDVAINGVIDAAACDSGQGPFTQLIERYIYAALGISDFFLDWYFSFRERYVMQSKYVRANMQFIKTSGEPGTLLGNTVLMGALLNAMLRGEGPMAMAIKGDDGFKRQANLKINSDIVKAISAQTVLEFKLDLDVPITFCGYVLVQGKLMPSISRKIIKIAGHRFKTYQHFTEYQESLRDWINKVPRDPVGNAAFLECNAQLVGRSISDMQRMLDGIVSVSRIGKEQFELFFPRKTFDLSLPPVNTETRQSKCFVSLGDDGYWLMRQKARVSFK
jgi:hypothetical protein